MHFFLPLGHSVRVFIVSRGILDSVPWSSHDNIDTVAHKQVKTTIFLINAVRGTAMTGGSGILCWTTVVIIQLTWHNTSRNKMTIYHARARKRQYTDFLSYCQFSDEMQGQTTLGNERKKWIFSYQNFSNN